MMMMTMMILTDTLKKMMTVIMSMIIMMMQASLYTYTIYMFRILSDLALDNLDDHDNDGDEDVENIIHSKDDNNDDFDGKEDEVVIMVKQGDSAMCRSRILLDLPSDKSDVNYDDNEEDKGKK